MSSMNSASAKPNWRRKLLLSIGILMLVANSTSFVAPVAAASLSDFGEPFHFLEPLGREAGDPARFDASLLDDLVVTICRVEAAECIPIKTLTSASSLSERLRIGPTSGGGSYYLANWDTSKVKLPPFTYRISVQVAGLVLGSTDVGQAQYKSFGRTWPIKFRVEKNPTIRVRILRSEEQSASQVANAIRIEFDLGPDDVALLLARDIDPYSAEEIDLAIRGVFQPAVIPATTKIADPATQAALTTFDATTGRMTFETTTSTLNALEVDDVLVGEPNAAAPNGYLRTVTSITRPKKGPVVVETRQASLNEAITEGTLDAAGELKPEDIQSTEALPGVTLREAQGATAMVSALDIGDGFDFHETIDITLDGVATGTEVNGRGTIHIQGEMRFNAGYNVGFGVEECFDCPPFFTHVDRFEAHAGFDAYTDIKVWGNFDGHLQKEVVLSTHYFKPIVFFIGPIPVVLVPVVKAMAGVKGDAHLEFSFEAQVSEKLDLGAKWTDPDDGGNGWKNVSVLPLPQGTADADLEATMVLRAYAKADAKLLLYGIAGPGFAGRVGLGADVQFPRNPLWQVFGHASAEITFSVDIAGILTLADYNAADLPEVKFVLKESENQPPVCGARTDPIPVAVGAVTYLGPRGNGDFQGYFDCNDPEGEEVGYAGSVNNVSLDLSAAKWDTSGTRVVDITATDESGESKTFSITVNVINTPPILTLTTATGTVPASVQYFVAASAYDVEEGDFIPCSSVTYSVTGGTATPTNDNRSCAAAIVFSQTGPQTITVKAVDSLGFATEKQLTVNVTVAPANPAPVIDGSSFRTYAASGPKSFCPDPFNCDTRYVCPTGFFCGVPSGAILYNGTVGDYHPPLTFSLDASDPNGDGLTVTWSCTAGSNVYQVTDNGDGTFSCSPYSSSVSIPILIRADVTDGLTTVQSEVRAYLMLDRVG